MKQGEPWTVIWSEEVSGQLNQLSPEEHERVVAGIKAIAVDPWHPHGRGVMSPAHHTKLGLWLYRLRTPRFGYELFCKIHEVSPEITVLSIRRMSLFQEFAGAMTSGGISILVPKGNGHERTT